MVHDFLKSLFFKKPKYRKGVYKEIRYKILPVLWKNHRDIEREKQKKLTFLAHEFDKVGKTIEAHVVRTIVKPYVRDLNLEWGKMSAVDKIRLLVPPIPEGPDT